ncbi:glycosyltransferase [Paenibacillus hamazuiensis]|uniref:glycosyltransferase n=1 Tax=Paenibacillus hamazuiensis TaxID=2936508 RepID=UPI00200C1F1F|nr:glycosyltransferase [Paenibacillus hamazuiensis]
MKTSDYKILSFATQGSGGDDENRLRALLSQIPAQFYPFEKRKKWLNFWKLLKYIFRERPHLVVMEGTGIAGGLALIFGNMLAKVPYIVSSGDAVGPFVASKVATLAPLFQWYERLLYKRSTGFIGWTPYLAGRALTYGAKYAMTAAGWAPFEFSDEQLQASRRKIREMYRIPENHIVVGIVGSLNWNKRIGYCYGYELVKAMQTLKRENVTVLIVGDGNGKSKLEQLSGERLGKNIVFTGRVPREAVPGYLASMDLASLPQSVDQVGSFRYTTKVSEYLSVGLPIVTGRIPMSYDINRESIYRIHGNKPWEPAYIHSLSELMENMTMEELQQKKAKVQRNLSIFDKESQIIGVSEFIRDILSQSLRNNAKT